MDLRPHGEWRATMRAPDGKACPQKGVFREIHPPQRLAFTFKWVNEPGPESLVTVELTERDGRTEMTFRQNLFRSREARDSHQAGWNESFDRLAHELSRAGSGKSPPPPARRGAAHRRLDMFVGRWNGAGQSMAGAPVPEKMTVAESYEWLVGECFLVKRGIVQIAGKEAVEQLWVFGYENSLAAYVIRAFDGSGSFREYRGSVRDRVWTLTGQWERARLEFSPDGTRFTAHWELSPDGATWAPLCDVTLTKAT
jgi:hypothetical protein